MIFVYQDATRTLYTAATRLGPEDWIMIDRHSADEAVQQLRTILPETMRSRAVVAGAGQPLQEGVW